jgi:hypothetical protein
MKVDRLTLLVPLALATVSASAGSTVYTCKTDAGTVYQDHPCATADATIDAKNVYAPKPCGGSCGTSNGSASAESVKSRGRQVQQEQSEVSVESVAVPSGFQCSGNGKTWIQGTPCPDSMTVYRPISVSGFDQYGNHFTGSGALKDQATVNQQGLSHDELCDQLHHQTPINTSRGKSGPSDTYERNKLRQQEGC